MKFALLLNKYHARCQPEAVGMKVRRATPGWKENFLLRQGFNLLARRNPTMVSLLDVRREIVEALLLSPLYLDHLTQQERLRMIRELERQVKAKTTAGN